MTISRRALGFVLLVGMLAGMLAGCSREAPPGPVSKAPIKEYAMRGQVLRLEPGTKTATVKHEEIVGWMGAMTMDYSVKDQTEFAKLHDGDNITATVFAQEDNYWIGRITATPAEKK